MIRFEFNGYHVKSLPYTIKAPTAGAISRMRPVTGAATLSYQRTLVPPIENMMTRSPTTPFGPRGPLAPPQNVKHYVAWLLSRQDYSEKQLHAKLKQRNVPKDEADAAVIFMQQHGFQDDARYAGSRVGQLAPKVGNRRLVADLQSKGIDPDVIADKLALVGPESERVLAACQRFVGKPLDPSLKAKVWRYLAYRGFGPGAIQQALAHLRQYRQGAETEPDDDDIPDDSGFFEG